MGKIHLAPQSFTSPNTLDAEERLLRGTSARTTSHHQHKRFLTLHRRRRKKPPTRSLHCDRALLDDLYHGPTQVKFLFFKQKKLIFNDFFFIGNHSRYSNSRRINSEEKGCLSHCDRSSII